MLRAVSLHILGGHCTMSSTLGAFYDDFVFLDLAWNLLLDRQLFAECRPPSTQFIYLLLKLAGLLMCILWLRVGSNFNMVLFFLFILKFDWVRGVFAVQSSAELLHVNCDAVSNALATPDLVRDIQPRLECEIDCFRYIIACIETRVVSTCPRNNKFPWPLHRSSKFNLLLQ